MLKDRNRLFLFNSTASFFQQIIALICGLIVPRLIIGAYGSAANGTVAAIIQFISITSLIQGGVSSASRVAFYKPVAQKNVDEISKVYKTSQLYFRKFAIGLFFYIVLLAFIYDIVFKSAFTYFDTAFMVLIIGLSAVLEYMFGITNQLLLFADNRSYINTFLSTTCTFISSIISVLLINSGATIHTVKLISGLILAIRPILLQFIVKRRYTIGQKVNPDFTVISQRYAALAKSIAFYIHTSTDTMVITLFLSPVWASIYAVHRYVVHSITSVVSSILGNTEAIFGHMIAENDSEDMVQDILVYDLMSKMLSGILFFTMMILISPFINLYTRNVKDVSYYHPTFAVLLCYAEMTYCMSLTYHNIIMAAGHIKQTKWISIMEALLNIGISIAMVLVIGIEGVAIGTLIAFVFNTLANIIYIKHNILNIRINILLKNYLCNLIPGCLIYCLFTYALKIQIESWIQFISIGIMVFCCMSLITVIVNYIFIKEFCGKVFGIMMNKCIR